MTRIAAYTGLPDRRLLRAITCLRCGRELAPAGAGKHVRACARHRRILAMLKKQCLTFYEIGQRVGLSRERVRQIATGAGMDKGRERQTACRWTRADASWAAHPRIVPVIEKAMQYGYEVEGIERRSTKGFLVSACYVNGRRCVIGSAWENPPGYQTVHCHAADYDFWLGLHKQSGTWLVIPRAKMPRWQTCFALKPDPRYGAKGHRHDWRDYIEAWHLLANKPDLSANE